MLKSYGRQAVAARRLARYKLLNGLSRPALEVEAERAVKRRAIVEKVAGEILENLLVAGSETPVVVAVREELNAAFGGPVEFVYPPTDPEPRIFQRDEEGNAEEILGEAKQQVLAAAWQIALNKVDETML